MSSTSLSALDKINNFRTPRTLKVLNCFYIKKQFFNCLETFEGDVQSCQELKNKYEFCIEKKFIPS